LPVRVRLYAAAKAVEFERDKSGHKLEEIEAQVRQEFLGDTDGYLDKLTNELKRHREVIIEYRDRQLRAWIDAGEITEKAAGLVRGLWADEGNDRPFHIDDLAMPDGGRARHA
jgi:hypothetical protein